MTDYGFLLHELSEFTLRISVCGNVLHDLQFSIGLPIFRSERKIARSEY